MDSDTTLYLSDYYKMSKYLKSWQKVNILINTTIKSIYIPKLQKPARLKKALTLKAPYLEQDDKAI